MTGMALDETHDPAARSWVAGAHGHPDFPIQNLPFGVYVAADGRERAGIAIGDQVLDLAVLLGSGLVEGEARQAAEAASGPGLNRLLALGTVPRRALRRRLFALLAETAPERSALEALPGLLVTADQVTPQVPAEIGDYTDFYAGIHHARAVGALFRPDNPLLPNYKYVPIGYHGRASSVRASGVSVRRPNGQYKSGDMAEPAFGPCRNLDYEVELGIWVGPGNALGEPVPIGRAADHIAGFCLLNDWSARDVQAWEYQPLGPFLAKNFHTTISPWIVTPEALAPFRIAPAPRPDGDPAALPYLSDPADQAAGALAIELRVSLLTAAARARSAEPETIGLSDARHLYWTPAQLLAHHTSGGCDLRPGDLLGSGTISGPEPGSEGSLLERTRGGREPLGLPNGETRRFLVDGDEVILTARAVRDGFASIGFGACRAIVLPAL